ncbi:hypothetical protein [Pedosphaera parvula]|uniref:Uncharacterized protein n=1 Tax=Pedosphaera parvula (strain Ellin514) TaxID=320771 RepID=B9XJA7_PEDPL|nr:hypothetical protein [Pedosphaera parvula]EEF60145.1 hypothetical protein Cflav_PD3204 [Pedosphaera parvula Ellin514]
MPFNDDNTMGHISGCYLVASAWPDFDSNLEINKKVAEFVERIEDKIARNRNKTRHNWFMIALGYARQAQQHYRNGQIETGRKLLRQAWEQLESGNKANRRKTTFVAGSDGKVRSI